MFAKSQTKSSQRSSKNENFTKKFYGNEYINDIFLFISIIDNFEDKSTLHLYVIWV